MVSLSKGDQRHDEACTRGQSNAIKGQHQITDPVRRQGMSRLTKTKDKASER